MPKSIKVLIILILLFLFFLLDVCNKHEQENLYEEIEKDTVEIKVV